MLYKPPSKKSLARKKVGFFAKFGMSLIAVELAGLGGTYYVWGKLNREQEFRLKAHHYFPWVLEAYYSFGEKMDEKNLIIRDYDRKTWMKNGQFFK